MKALFVSSGNHPSFPINTFIYAQGESLKQAGVDLSYFQIKGKGILGYLSAVRPLRREIKQNKYDIVHAHYVLSAWVALLTFTSPPLVVSFMGSDTYGDSYSTKKDRLLGLLNKKLAWLIQFFIEAIIVKSEYLYQFIHKKDKTYIIPNGVDFNRFKPFNKMECREELSLRKDKIYILFLGDKKTKRKNFFLANASVSCLGDPNIELINPYPIEHSLVPKYLSASDILLLTSYEEGSPNVIKEALACNCKIISTDVGDIKTLSPHISIIYSPDATPQTVAEMIRTVLNREESVNTRNDIEELRIEKIAQRIISVYINVLHA